MSPIDLNLTFSSKERRPFLHFRLRVDFYMNTDPLLTHCSHVTRQSLRASLAMLVKDRSVHTIRELQLRTQHPMKSMFSRMDTRLLHNNIQPPVSFV